LRDAAADPGLRGAGDAEPARAVRAAQEAVPRARPCPPDGAGQAGRLSRPRPAHRRSALRRRADRTADLQGLRQPAPQPMDPDRALPWDKIPSYGSLAGDTVYVAAVDKDGNAASLIQSVYGSFGAAVVAGRTGVVLQNRSAYFS